jgi:hypothetical protein
MSFSRFIKAMQQASEVPVEAIPRPRAGMRLGPVKDRSAVISPLNPTEPAAHLTDDQLRSLVIDE